LSETVGNLLLTLENCWKMIQFLRKYWKMMLGSCPNVGKMQEGAVPNAGKMQENAGQLLENAGKMQENAAKLLPNAGKMQENAAKLPPFYRPTLR